MTTGQSCQYTDGNKFKRRLNHDKTEMVDAYRCNILCALKRCGDSVLKTRTRVSSAADLDTLIEFLKEAMEQTKHSDSFNHPST